MNDGERAKSVKARRRQRTPYQVMRHDCELRRLDGRCS